MIISFLPRSGLFTQESTKYDLLYHTVGCSNSLHPSLSRQFRINDHQLWYRRLPHNIYSDTLFATTVPRRGKNCAQIFATNFGWSCSFPMKLKSEANVALSLLFQWDGVPLAMICDNAKEMILGEFNRKLKETLYHLRQSHSPHG